MFDPATVVVGGFSQDVQINESGGMDTYSPLQNSLDATFTETIDASGNVTYAQIKDDNITATFDTRNGGAIYPSKDNNFLISYGGNIAGDTYNATAANPYSEGWNYQSFGVWQYQYRNSGAIGAFGAISVGSTTPGGAIPTSGSVTFNGAMAIAGPTQAISVASMTISVDFGARTATLSSGAFYAEESPSLPSNFTLGGTLTYQAGQNDLSGTVDLNVSGTPSASGPAIARFYGPAAQEIGGTFMMHDTGNAPRPNYYAGAFGAARSH